MSEVRPSVPLVVYLFAARLLPGRSRVPHGVHVPCTHEQVPTQSLAMLLFATAFWSLRKQGVIAMDVGAGADNGWISHRPELRIKRLGSVSRPGLEGAVLDHFDDEDGLCDIVCRWSGMRSNDPWHDAIHEEVAEAVAGGYLNEVPNSGGVLARLLWRESEFESNCRRIAGLEDEFLRVDQGWRLFKDQDRDLSDHLMAECKRSLLTATECWYP